MNTLAERCDLNGGEREKASNDEFEFDGIQVLRRYCVGGSVWGALLKYYGIAG
jgi:hypothetical protein